MGFTKRAAHPRPIFLDLSPLRGGRGGRLTTDDIGSKRTNHKFGCVGEVCQTNIRIPSKIPFILKCVFLNFINIFVFKKGGAPPPARAVRLDETIEGVMLVCKSSTLCGFPRATKS